MSWHAHKKGRKPTQLADKKRGSPLSNKKKAKLKNEEKYKDKDLCMGMNHLLIQNIK